MEAKMVFIDGVHLAERPTNIRLTDFTEHLKKGLPFSITEYKNRYVINQCLLLVVSDRGGFVTDFSLEGCFSWYDENINLIYEVAQFIHRELIPIKVCFSTKLEFLLEDKADFAKRIKEQFATKYDTFIYHFGYMHIKLLPGEPFYSFREKNRSGLEKLRRFFIIVFRRFRRFLGRKT